MSETIYRGKIDGRFEGFNNETLFKMRDGTYWVQIQHKKWNHHAYSPDVTITEESGRASMTVAGNSVLVRRVKNVIESRINGTFTGWDGDTSYNLVNGQVWQQRTYKYQYKYAYMPIALVYPASGGHKMIVAGTIANVRRV